MERTYVYRKHLRAPVGYLIGYAAVIFLAILILSGGLILTDGEKLGGDGTSLMLPLMIMGVMLLFAFFVIILELVFLYFVLFRRFQAISVTLAEDAIIYENGKGRTRISYDEIQRLEFPSVKYMGGWIKIIYPGGNIRLTVVLENIGDFVNGLQEKLKEKNLENTYNEKKLFSFVKTAVFADDSWERLYRNCKLVVAVFYLSMLFTIGALVFLDPYGQNQIFLLASILMPLAGFLISEIIVGMKVKKRVIKEELRLLPRDAQAEQKIFYISFFLFTALHLVILLIAKLL